MLKWREGSRKSKKTETSKFLLTYKPSRYIICNIVTYKLSRNQEGGIDYETFI